MSERMRPEAGKRSTKSLTPKYRHKQPELLDGPSIREHITWCLEQMSEKDLCAVFMIEFDDTYNAKEKLGQKEKAHLAHCAGQRLSAFFKASDLVSRIGEKEFLAFMSGRFSVKDATEKAREICEGVRFETGEKSEVCVTACVGAYVASGDEITFEKLFGQAAAALYEAKNNGRGSSCVFTDQSEAGASDRAGGRHKSEPISLDTLLKYLDGGVSLLEVGPEIKVIYANQGFYHMLGIEPEKLSLPCDLDQVVIHPDYREDYIRTIREGAQKEEPSDHVHRASGDGKHWRWRHVRLTKVAYPGSLYPVMLEISTDISEVIEKDRQLQESNERLRVAFRQMPHILWEVDLGTRTFNTYNVEKQCCLEETAIEDFPWSFLDQGIIHTDSAADFRDFAENLLAGKAAGSGNFIIRDRVNNCYGWVSLSYRMTYDRDGLPVKAIGVQSKLPSMAGLGSDAIQRRPLPEAVFGSLLLRMKVNLTADSMDEVWIGGIDQTAWTWGKTYSELLHAGQIQMFTKTKEEEFGKQFDRENLLAAYDRGEYWSRTDYQRVDEGGNIRWMSASVNLVKDSKTEDIRMYACLCDMQKRHDWEKMAEEPVKRDPVSGLYAEETFARIVEKLLQGGGQGNCALTMIRMIGEPWNDEEKSRDLRQFVAAALSLALGADCILGQYRQDSMMVFFPQIGTKFDGKRRIEDAFAYLRISMPNIIDIVATRFVAGTVAGQMNEVDYEILRLKAGYLCEVWKDVAVDTVVFPGKDEDWSWVGLRRENKEEEIQVQKEKPERPLTKEEQNTAFHCVTDMLTAGTMEASILSALSSIGEYYQASRVYFLVLGEDEQTLTMAHEWTSDSKQSIRNIMSGMKVNDIPLLKRCLKEGKAISTDTPNLASEEGGVNRRWHFIAFPIRRDEETQGFLCVENPQKLHGDVTLLETLVPYIQNEERRFQLQKERAAIPDHDTLTSLPNLSSYLDVIYSLNSDSYTSMGAVAMDVPYFTDLNNRFGFEYGKRLLLYLSEMLAKIFGRAYIFRTWDTEFVVLFPNTTQEVFGARCNRLRTVIQRRYPRKVRMGYVWAEGIFSASNMVREAQKIMINDKNGLEADDWTANADEGLTLEDQEYANTRFVPYFQPKIDMRSGQMTGAEALARGVDPDGTILVPAQFIEELEHTGSVRELDLFMLEAVMKQLSDWKGRGIPLPKVSINISRITLFNPMALASVLAIQSRYPEIPADQIELEITETAGDMENATLAQIVRDFEHCGILFELDDFGTGYANMSVLSNIQFSTVKLDRSLVNDLPGNEISGMLVQNITEICKNFHMKCVAEGVETVQQRDALLAAGCIYGQGYYYARPLSSQEFEKQYLS